MRLDKLFHTTSGKTMISIILGLGIASLFRQACKGTNCVLVKALPMDSIANTVYKHPSSERCIRYEVNPVKCDKSKKIYHYD